MSDLTTSWVGVDFGTISCAAAVLIGNLPVPVTLGFESAAFLPGQARVRAIGPIDDLVARKSSRSGRALRRTSDTMSEWSCMILSPSCSDTL